MLAWDISERFQKAEALHEALPSKEGAIVHTHGYSKQAYR